MTGILANVRGSSAAAISWASTMIPPEGEAVARANLRASALPLSGMTWRNDRGIATRKLSCVRLVAEAEEELDTSTIQREFPTMIVERAEACAEGELVVDDFAWRGAFDFSRFDEAIELSRSLERIVVRGSDAPGVACEVLSRYQRLIMRRNTASSTPLFDAILDAHASVFASVKLDLEHALDTWQWMLRLEPEVGLAPQIGALFHDIDRLDGDPHGRVEHRAHRTLDDAQAKGGAERTLSILRRIGVEEEEARRVHDLIGGHVQRERDAILLDDADALSFLSLMSPSYADYFGLAQTRRKVAFTLGRLAPVARERVALFRLRPDIHRLLHLG